MGCTTAPCIEMGVARRQLELVGVLPILYGDGLSTCLPCPPALMADIILINHLRSKANEETAQVEKRQYAALELLNCIRSFSVEQWARCVKSAQQADYNETSGQKTPESLDWQTIGNIYQSAIALYCISSLLEPEGTQLEQPASAIDQPSAGVDNAALALTYRNDLLGNLERVSSAPHSQLRKLVLWPLVIAGIELDNTDTASKTFIVFELEWMSRSLGTASPLVAKEYLTRLWSTGRSKVHGWDAWNHLFDRPYVFAM